MVSEYYGCRTIKDEDVIDNDEICLTDKDTFLNFIKSMREVTGSNEPLIYVPTRQKGKTQSAKMGSCHWAVKKLIEQHLGKQFACYNLCTNSVNVSTNIADMEYYIGDNNFTWLTGYYHSVWQTPEEKLVNVINYHKQRIDLYGIKENTAQGIWNDFNFRKDMLVLPVNEKCYPKIEKDVTITYQNLHYFSDRKKSLDDFQVIKNVKEKLSDKQQPELPKGLIYTVDGVKDYKVFERYKDKLIMVITVSNEFTVSNVNQEESFRKMNPDFYDRTLVSNNFETVFEKSTFILDDYDLASSRNTNTYKKGNEEEFFTTSYVSRDRNWIARKDLFLEPSIVTKSWHYEQGANVGYNDQLEYRIIDKDLVIKQANITISKMSEAQKKYETKRAEKRGLTLQEHIIQQKYKLAS